MGKREIVEVEESSAKRRKIDAVGGATSSVEQVESARQMQQHLTFQQDSVPQLRKGKSITYMLDPYSDDYRYQSIQDLPGEYSLRRGPKHYLTRTSDLGRIPRDTKV